MYDIIPGILEKDFVQIEKKIELVRGFAKTIHVDIIDTKFSSSTTFFDPKPFAKYTNDFLFEVHLMVKDPEKIIPLWRNAGIRGIVIHAETENIEELAQKYYSENFERESPLYTELGIAVNLNTPIEIVYPLVEMSDFIQLMGIEEIGAQGRPFDERVYEKIKDLKAKFPHCIISIDGGVSEENAQKLIDCGADKLVIGSAVFGNQNPAEAYKRIRASLVNKK